MKIELIYDGDGNVMVIHNEKTKSFFVEYPDETSDITDYLYESLKKVLPKYKGE